MTTSTTAGDDNVPAFTHAVRSEWVKFITLRSARRNLFAGVVFGILSSLALAFVSGLTYDKWDEAGRADFDPLLYPAVGALLTAVFFATVGVGAMASEYRTGMMSTTLIATPRRSYVFLAKAIVVSAATTLAGVVVTIGMYGGSHLVYVAYDLPTFDLWTWRAVRVLVVGTLTTALFPLLAQCLATFTRSTASALTMILVMMFAPSIIGTALPKWWQEHVLVLLPGPASDALTVGHITEVDRYLHPAVALTVVLTWVVVSGAAAIAIFTKRDA